MTANWSQIILKTSNSSFYKELGKNIQKFRKKTGLSQGDIAKRLGVTPQQFQKYEAGLCSSIAIHTILIIAESINVSLSDLLSINQEQGTRTTKTIAKVQRFARDSNSKDDTEF